MVNVLNDVHFEIKVEAGNCGNNSSFVMVHPSTSTQSVFLGFYAVLILWVHFSVCFEAVAMLKNHFGVIDREQ